MSLTEKEISGLCLWANITRFWQTATMNLVLYMCDVTDRKKKLTGYANELKLLVSLISGYWGAVFTYA